MTKAASHIDETTVAALLTGFLHDNGPDIQNLSVAVYRALAEGQPLDIDRLAVLLNWPAEKTSAALAGFPESFVQFDDRGRIAAFVGLSVVPAPHEFRIAGRRLFTWCVLDALFLPEILGKPATLTTTCPHSRRRIGVEIESHGIASSSPPDTVMSLPATNTDLCRENLRGAFCNHVNMFANLRAFERWSRGRPHGGCVSLAEAFELGRARNDARYPDIRFSSSALRQETKAGARR